MGQDSASPQLWFRRYGEPAGHGVQLICFPHAGGSASAYRTWARGLPRPCGLLAVRYPGREDRLDDPFPAGLEALADDIAGAIMRAVPQRVVLFGHSMGASVAHEVALRLDDRLLALCVSSRKPPRLLEPSPVADRSDDDIVEDLLTLNDAAAEALADPELRELVMPPLRADYRLVDSYHPVGLPRLTCPVLAYTGAADPDADDATMRHWSETTFGQFSHRVFQGGHFYLRAQEAALLADLAQRIELFSRGRECDAVQPTPTNSLKPPACPETF